MPKNENRLNIINEELRKEISQIISFELKNPDATGLISVTKVKVTPDLKYAKVYISLLNSKNEEKTIEAIQDASGFIRSLIAKRINLVKIQITHFWLFPKNLHKKSPKFETKNLIKHKENVKWKLLV